MNRIFRKFCALLIGTALAIAVGNMACGDSIEDLDRSDETEGAT